MKFVKIPESCDVVIVGGGPSGVMAAYGVAREGYSAVILDKKEYQKIGNKTCGEALDKPVPILLKEKFNIDLPQDSELPSKISYLSFSAEKPEFKLKARAPAFITNRLNYGQRLLKEAKNVGAKVFGNAPVRDVIVEDKQIVGVKFHYKGKIKTIRSKVVIDSSGYIGIIRKLIPNELKHGVNYKLSDKYTVATYREIIELDEKHDYLEEVLLFYVEHIPMPGYAWIFTSGPRQLNIGIIWPKSVPYPDNKSLKDIYHETFYDYYAPSSYKILHKGGGQIPIGLPFDSLVFNGAILTGDAASVVNPVTAEGHTQALLTGYEAAVTSISALKKASFKREDLWDYNVRIMNTMGKTSIISLYVQDYFKKIGAKGLAFLLKRGFATQKDLERIFAENNFKFSSWEKIKKVIRVTPRFGLLIKFAQLLRKQKEGADLYLKYPENPKELDTWIQERNDLPVL